MIGTTVQHWYFGQGTVVEFEPHTGALTDTRVDFGVESYGLQWVASTDLRAWRDAVKAHEVTR